MTNDGILGEHRVMASVLVFDTHAAVLARRHPDTAGEVMWSLPEAPIRPGQYAELAARCLLADALGVRPDLRLIGAYSETDPSSPTLRLLFHAQLVTPPAPRTHTDGLWWHPAELALLHLTPWTITALVHGWHDQW